MVNGKIMTNEMCKHRKKPINYLKNFGGEFLFSEVLEKYSSELGQEAASYVCDNSSKV